MELSPNARRIMEMRYSRKDAEGNPTETPEQVVARLAGSVADVTLGYVTGGSVKARKAQRDLVYRGYRDMLDQRLCFPNSPTWTGAGTPLGQLSACFVLPIEDDLGRERAGIFSTLRDAVLIQQTGGGNGFDFSRLRPRDAIVARSMGKASGPVGFLEAYDSTFLTIAQGGSRRGANMAVMRADHPDVRRFIKAKIEEGKIENFNISVAATDDFMGSVLGKEEFDLRHGGRTYETIKAYDLFEEIAEAAWAFGDPGLLFIDRANRDNPCPLRYTYEATNPCLTGDALIATPEGWRRLDTIQVGDPICTVLGQGAIKEIEVHENTPVYEVKFSDGGSLRATAAHQFHVRDSRTKFFTPTRLDQMRPGQWVRVAKAQLPTNQIEPSYCLSQRDLGFIIGVMVGDGSCSPKTLDRNQLSICSHSDEHEWNDVLVAFLEKMGYSVGRDQAAGSNSLKLVPAPSRPFADWYRSLSLGAALAPDKELPEEYINSNGAFLEGLLDGLFSTDGSVNLRSNHPQVRFHTASPKLAEQVRLILLMFGVHARVSQSQRKPHTMADGREIRYDRPKFDVVISGESFGRFADQITLSHPDKQAKLNEARLRCNFTGGNWAAQVVSIEPGGSETVYDLYEPLSDTWNAQGYIQRGCGEQWLPPYGSCNLGSIALQRFVRYGSRPASNEPHRAYLDWDALETCIHIAVNFLDDIIDANHYVEGVPELEATAKAERRIGLGYMGIADAMAMLGIRYGSRDGQDFVSQVTEFLRFHAMKASIRRAAERGAFPWIEGSIFDPHILRTHGFGVTVPGMADNFRTWLAPAPIVEHIRGWGRPALDWNEIDEGLKEYGIRNACVLTYAPTGTISNVADCEGSGIECFFAIVFERKVMESSGSNQVFETLHYASRLFEDALIECGFDDERRAAIIEQVAAEGGSCQNVGDLPQWVKDSFVTAADLTWEEHIRMQAAAQAWVDNSISKTINMPNHATVDDVKLAYGLAYELGCKGITVYRQGSRSLEVLSAAKKNPAGEVATQVVPDPQEVVTTLSWPVITPMAIPRSAEEFGLPTRTFPVKTAFGTLQVYVTEHPDHPGRPFDCRISIGKHGSDKNADVEALARMISISLRAGVDVAAVVDQLKGIGGRSISGFGPNKVFSVADGVGKLLERLYLTPNVATESVYTRPFGALPIPTTTNEPIVYDTHIETGMTCPNCGVASLVFESGCLHCDLRLGGCGEYSGCD